MDITVTLTFWSIDTANTHSFTSSRFSSCKQTNEHLQMYVTDKKAA